VRGIEASMARCFSFFSVHKLGHVGVGRRGARMHSLGVSCDVGPRRTRGRLRSLLFRRKRYQSLGSTILYGSLSCKRDMDACHQACHINNKHTQYGATRMIVGSPKTRTCSMFDSAVMCLSRSSTVTGLIQEFGLRPPRRATV
jgi:hypothetical protein